MKLAIFIGRLNPPHIGHISTIKKALSENDRVLVWLGTPLVQDNKNILNFKQRKKLLNIVFGSEEKLEIAEMLDVESDEVWTYNIEKYINKNYNSYDKLNFYFGDIKNDSVYSVIKKYEKILGKYDLEYKEISRKDSFINHKGKKYYISATNLRKALLEKDLDLAIKYCDKDMFSEIKKYFK